MKQTNPQAENNWEGKLRELVDDFHIQREMMSNNQGYMHDVVSQKLIHDFVRSLLFEQTKRAREEGVEMAGDLVKNYVPTTREGVAMGLTNEEFRFKDKLFWELEALKKSLEKEVSG